MNKTCVALLEFDRLRCLFSAAENKERRRVGFRKLLRNTVITRLKAGVFIRAIVRMSKVLSELLFV